MGKKRKLKEMKTLKQNNPNVFKESWRDKQMRLARDEDERLTYATRKMEKKDYKRVINPDTDGSEFLL